MRFALPPLTPAIKGLVIVNVVLFVVAALLTNFANSTFIWDQLALSPGGVLSGRVWQPFTYMWLHSTSGTGHLLFNMLFLYLFGAQFEQMTSTRRTLQTYVLTGLAGAALVVLSGLLWQALPLEVPYLKSTWATPTVGASGAVSGILAAWCGLLWGQRRNFLLVGSIKIEWFFYFMVALELLGALVTDGVSTACHLGGLGAGLALGRGNLLSRANVWWERRKLLQKQAELQKDLDRFTVIDGGRDDKDENGDDWIH